MKQKINGPVAVGVIIVIALLLLGGFYMKFLHEPSYTAQDVAAKMKRDSERMQHGGGPPNMTAGHVPAPR